MADHQDDQETGSPFLYEEAQKIILSIYIYIQSGTKWMDSGPFQWCTGPEPEAKSTNWNTRGSIKTSGNTSVLCRRWSTGTGCPASFQSLPPEKCSKPAWHCPGQRVLDDPARAGVGELGHRCVFKFLSYWYLVILYAYIHVHTNV